MELRHEAAGLDDKPGMQETAARLRREARAITEDADSRRGWARACEERAAEFADERVGVGI